MNILDVEKARFPGLDIIRIVATFFVLSVHFFGRTNYYFTPLSISGGANMFFLTVLRWLVWSCVPLFLLLTGYLNYKKLLVNNAKQYYGGIRIILFTYVFSCILCNLYKILVEDQVLSFFDWINSIFGFYANPYSWYINMYIGLFLLIPFLNALYLALTINLKRILIITFIFLTALPVFTNQWISVLPNYWTLFYPITYYFIGAYMSEYKIHLKELVKNNFTKFRV